MMRQVPVWARWLALLALVVAAFSAGRFSAPREVDERVEYRTEWRTKNVEVTRWRTAKTTATRTTTTPVLLPTPDGGVLLASSTTMESLERELAGGHSAYSTEASGEERGAVDVRVTQQPAWRLGAQVGASLRAPAVQLAGPLVLGVSVERRLVGGVSAGLWANTVGAAGASLSVEF